MAYLYHWVPKDMRGDVLFPLNTLKEIYPDVYAEQASKYADRQHIMQQRIPVLDCLWNDVLHFSAVHPSLVKQALLEAGKKETLDLAFFEIDPHLLNPENTIVYLYTHPKTGDGLDPRNFSTYNPAAIEEYTAMPQETKDYYKQMIGEGKRPLLFHKTPHILFKGSLDVSKIKKISW